MANPLPGQEAIDNGNGTATTRYDDGSSVTWRIDTGAFVSSAPRPGTGLVGTVGPPQPSTWGAAGDGRGAGWGSIGAGTQWTAPGWGVPGFGQAPLAIRPEYQQYLQTAPGYIPGSGTYNQFRLGDQGLLTNILGKTVNARYGQGGTGDPTTGREPQTPQEWLAGPRAFGWDFNMGQTPQTQGMDYIANLFGRPDAGSSGISTAAWSAPQEYWAGLADAVQKGLVKASPFGLKALAAKGFNVTPPGGAVDLGASGRAGGGGTTGTGGAVSPQDQALQDYLASVQANAQAMQAAQLAYQDWVMRTGDDKLAFEKAQQEYENKYNEQLFAYQKQKDQWTLQQSAGYFDVDGQRTQTLAGIAQEAGLTGMYQGKPTFQREQYESGVMENLLGLQAGLRGPENYAQYLKVLGSTPQGMRDVVNAAAGRFQMPSTSGVTPGQTTTPADLQSLLRDVTSGGANAQADWSQALSGGLPNPNQLNLKNWSTMLPTQQKMLMSAYEGQGWDPADVQKMIQQSSPLGAVGSGGSTGTFKF
jgi:hypothetical protein